MVLSSPSVGSTPSDASDAPDLHPQFEGVMLSFQSDTAAFDTTLLLEDPFSSATTDNGLGYPPTTNASKESSSDVRLLEEPRAGKLLDVLDSAFDSSLAGIDFGELASLAAGGLLPSEIDPGIAAFLTSAFEQPYKLPVPTTDHAEISTTSLSDLLLDPNVADKRSLRRRDKILVPLKIHSPAAPSQSTS